MSDSSSTPNASLGSSTRTVAELTLVSRLAGLARDVVTARIFGDTLVGSAFAAAFAIPNTFRRLFGEGALSAAFLPEYTRLTDDGSPADAPDADRFASLTVLLLVLVTGVLTLVLEAVLVLVLALAPANPDRAYALRLVMVVLPFMPLVCVAAIMGGMLQAHGRFGPWAAAPVLLNAVLIGAGVPYFFIEGATAESWGYILCAAAVIAGGVQVLWSLHVLRRHVRWRRDVGPAAARTKAMLKRMLPALIGLGTLQINGLLDTLIAMWPAWVGPKVLGYTYPLDDASNAILSYAQRLYQFPLGVFGIAVATAAFPMLSRAAHDPDRFADVIRRALRLSLFIALPASAGLAIVAHDLVFVLFSGGGEHASGFSADGVERATLVTLCYAGAVWAYSANHVLTRAFYAADDTTTPMRVAIAMVALNLTLNLTLIWFFREAGLALSTAISAVVQTLVLWWLARKRLIAGRLFDAPTARAIAMLVLMALAMGGVTWGVSHLLGGVRGSWAGRLGAVGAISATGAIAYAGLAVLLRRPELGWLVRRGADA